jgi:hypothetical protein
MLLSVTHIIQDVPGGKVNILGGHSIGHSKKKIFYEHVSYPNGFWYFTRTILNLVHNSFLPSCCNVPLSETCESMWSISWLLWLLLIGPTILEDRMTAQNYLDFLLHELPEQLEDVPVATRIAMYFQHDRALPHYTRLVMQHLNDTFPNRWICYGGSINWPPSSPDLTPFDFCLWGWMKSEVYRRRVDTWDELPNHIMDATACIKEHLDELRQATFHVPTQVFENLL